MRSLRLLVSTALATLPVFAPTPAGAMTWAEARAEAQRRAPELAVALQRSVVARTDVEIAGALANPSFTVTTARETAKLATGVVLPLPLFGQRGVAMRAASADADAVDRGRDIDLNDVRWNATLAWIDAWEVTLRARLLATAAEDARRLSAIASERFEAGSAPRLDVVRATADGVRAEADADSAHALVAAAGARLAVWVGADPISPPTIDGGPGVPARLPPLERVVADAAAHPALRRDEAQGAAAHQHVELEQRLRFPIVNAELVVAMGDPTLIDAQGIQRTDVIGGASFELPILNARGGAIAQARARGALAEATRAFDAAHLRADLVESFRRTGAAAARAHALGQQVVPAIEEARSMTEESYRAGRADLVRVLEAQRAVVDARVAELEAIATWARSFADLERAAGRALADPGLGRAAP
jgi:outer membrane protein TolC